jgi:hypothetical protein
VAGPDALQVVGSEEGVEAQSFTGLGHPKQIVIGSALLGLGEDAQIHRYSLGLCWCTPRTDQDRRQAT